MILIFFLKKIHAARFIIQNFVFGPPVKKVAHACIRPSAFFLKGFIRRRYSTSPIHNGLGFFLVVLFTLAHQGPVAGNNKMSFDYLIAESHLTSNSFTPGFPF